MTQSVVDLWVEELVAARSKTMRCAPAIKPTSLKEAYDIQSGVAKQIGPIGGFKTARKGDAPPIMAPIFVADMVRSGAQVPVSDHLGIELEVGFKIIGDFPA